MNYKTYFLTGLALNQFIFGAVQITDGFLFLKIESKKPKAKETNIKK